jgi:hypothetical protein
MVAPSPRPIGPRRKRNRFHSSRAALLSIALFALLVPPTARTQPAGEVAENTAGEPTTLDPADLSAAEEPPNVALAQFTTAIEDREPVDQITFVENHVRTVYFYSDLRGMQDLRVVHRWIHDGKTTAEVPFDVKGPRWRVWSSKELDPGATGDWTVEIETQDGEVLASETFSYSVSTR